MQQSYKDIIFTNHAMSRMKERSISEHSVWQVLQHPDISRPEDKPNTTRFIRTISDRKYHVVGTYLPDKKKTLIISAWVRGEEDKQPLMWRIITLPFRLLWKILIAKR